MSKNTVDYWKGETRKEEGNFLEYEKRFDTKKMRSLTIVQDFLGDADSLDQAGLSVCGVLGENFPECFRGLYHLDDMGENSLISFENPDVRIYNREILESITSGENYELKDQKGSVDYHIPLRGKEQIRKQIDYPRNPACIIGSLNVFLGEDGLDDLEYFEKVAGRVGYGLHHGFMLRNLTDSNDYIKDFLSAMSHDTLERIASMGFDMKLVMRKLPDGEMNERLSYAHEKSQKLNRYLRMWIENNPSRMKRHEMRGDVLNLVDVMKEALEFYDSDLKIHSTKITENFKVKPAEIFGDKTQLSFVYRNLIGNAINHGDKKWLEIGTEDLDERTAKTYVKNSGGMVGGEEMFKDRVKGPDSKGLGIGLGLVQSFVRSHKGRIEMESDGKTYTRFNVFLNKL